MVSILKGWSRGVFLGVDANWRDYHLLEELPLIGISFNMERDMRPMERIRKDIEDLAKLARKRHLILAVDGVHTVDCARLAVGAGARFVSGHYLVSAVSKPLPAFSMDWLDIGDLCAPADTK